MLGGSALVAASTSGTFLGFNPASFSGDFIRAQINGADKWRIDNDGFLTQGMGITTGHEWSLGNADDSGASGIVVHDGDSASKPGYINLVANNGDVFLYAAGGTDGRLAVSGTKPGAESVDFLPSLESADTLKNKILDNSNKFSDRIQSAEIATPGTPASGYGYGYFDTSGNFCTKNDGGDVICLSTHTHTVAVQLVACDFATDTTTGDGKYYFSIPSKINGWDLTGVSAQVVTTGTTNTLNMDLARCDVVAAGNMCSGTVQDMLSTNLTIDSGEGRSATAATAAVINTDYDDVATDEVVRVDIDGVHTTAAKGLVVNLKFEKP